MFSSKFLISSLLVAVSVMSLATAPTASEVKDIDINKVRSDCNAECQINSKTVRKGSVCFPDRKGDLPDTYFIGHGPNITATTEFRCVCSPLTCH